MTHPVESVYVDGISNKPVKGSIRSLWRSRVLIFVSSAAEVAAMTTLAAKGFVLAGVTWLVDLADTTSPHNGTTVIVSADGYRYKPAGNNVPAGGTDGQALVKNGSTAYATRWANRREVLTSNLSLYVRKDGSDSNTGLTDDAAGAFLTIQKAIDTAATIDFAGLQVFIFVRAGTYAEALTLRQMVGGNPILIGEDTDPCPGNVIISLTGNQTGFTLAVPQFWAVRGFKITHNGTGITSGGFGMNVTAGEVQIRNIDFSSFNSTSGLARHINAAGSGVVSTSGNYVISGGVGYHAVIGGNAILATSSRTITLSGTPAWGQRGWYMTSRGTFTAFNMNFVGSATGARYLIDNKGFIKTNGGGASYLPGNAAGSTLEDGLYT